MGLSVKEIHDGEAVLYAKGSQVANGSLPQFMCRDVQKHGESCLLAGQHEKFTIIFFGSDEVHVY